MNAPWTPPDRHSVRTAPQIIACTMCRHFEPGSTQYSSGECHRYAPRAQDTGYGLFPKVPATTWCGEWQSDEPEAAE